MQWRLGVRLFVFQMGLTALSHLTMSDFRSISIKQIDQNFDFGIGEAD